MEKGFKVLRGDAALDAANGTSFHDRVVFASYDELVEVLGEPSWTGSGDDKVQVHWILSFGVNVVTVYDWKESFDVVAESDTRIMWHLGGAGSTLLEDKAVRWFQEQGFPAGAHERCTSLKSRTIRLRPGERW